MRPVNRFVCCLVHGHFLHAICFLNAPPSCTERPFSNAAGCWVQTTSKVQTCMTLCADSPTSHVYYQNVMYWSSVAYSLVLLSWPTLVHLMEDSDQSMKGWV